jgi:predicted RNA-binding protein with PIN domain
MTNKILIDGWNVCWKIPESAAYIPEDLPRARIILNSKIKSYFQQRKVIYKIIYDGQPGLENYERLSSKGEIRFSKNPEKADHLIISFLNRQSESRLWTVVTSDIPLTQKVKLFGATVISSDEFIDKVVTRRASDRPTYKENPNLSKQEMETWLNLFNRKK